MAEFNLNCPYCGIEVTAEADWIGLDVECPSCRKHFIIERERNRENNIPVDLLHAAGGSEQNEQGNSGILPTEERIQKKAKTKCSKKFLMSAIGIIFIILLFGIGFGIGFGIIHFIAGEKRVAEEKRIAEEKRVAEETQGNEVKQKIQMAKDTKTYQEAFVILEDVIAKYPNNSYTDEARKLLQKYKLENAKPVCPACKGEGSYLRYWNKDYNRKYKCSICSGEGRISSERLQSLRKCSFCSGTGEKTLAGIRGICDLCGGSGYFVRDSDLVEQ